VKSPKWILSLLLVLCPSLPAAGETLPWTCAVTAFSGSLERENTYLFRQIPLQLYFGLSEYPEHRLTPSERLLSGEEDLNARRKSLLDEWESLLGKRDELIFTGDPLGYETLTKQIGEARKKYESTLLPSDSGDVVRPVQLLSPGSGGILFSSPERAALKDPDFIITGTLDDLGDYILIQVLGIFRAEGEEIPLWEGAAKTEQLDRLVGEIADALKEPVLGRAWSALSVSSEPAHGQIFLNGVSLGVGTADEEILEPGPALLEVRYPRYEVYREELDLLPGERIIRDIRLEPGEEDLITLESVPTGADVILGSVYRGRTPLVLSRPLIPEKLILSLEGYDRVSSTLGPESENPASFALTSGGVDWEEKRLDSQGKFYNSLGWFSLSLAAPLILNGIRENQALLTNRYASLYNAYGTQDYLDKYGESYDNYYLSEGLFWGSMAVSGVLLGVSITRLVQYIKASEKSIEQR